MSGHPGLADTPEPPYYAVIFTSVLADERDYADTAARMLELAAQQAGYLGAESAGRNAGLGITVSYWRDLEAIRAWRDHAEHAEARRLGRERFYSAFRLRIARVERAGAFDAD